MVYRKGRMEIPTFHWSIDMVVTPDVVEYAKSRGWPGGVQEETTDGITLWFSKEQLSVIIIQPDASAGVIAHEAWHAVRRMLLHVGAELENEVVAYHLGYVVNHLTNFKNGVCKKNNRGLKDVRHKRGSVLPRRKAGKVE